ncbi:MAG: hypothetical protein C5B49_06785 [Bdellovibrio sp.]|nr:MAG: hypothetical protein C5B49_06785 [Bdellovibrio sp.]
MLSGLILFATRATMAKEEPMAKQPPKPQLYDLGVASILECQTKTGSAVLLVTALRPGSGDDIFMAVGTYAYKSKDGKTRFAVEHLEVDASVSDVEVIRPSGDSSDVFMSLIASDVGYKEGAVATEAKGGIDTSDPHGVRCAWKNE